MSAARPCSKDFRRHGVSPGGLHYPGVTNASKSATNVPKDSRHQVLYRGGSFVPLSGSAGAKILFQFRLRSQGMLDAL